MRNDVNNILIFRLNKLNVEEQIVANDTKFTDENSYLTIEEFSRRLNVAVDNDSTKNLFRIFVKVWNGC